MLNYFVIQSVCLETRHKQHTSLVQNFAINRNAKGTSYAEVMLMIILDVVSDLSG
jgi:hypothetical protein